MHAMLIVSIVRYNVARYPYSELIESLLFQPQKPRKVLPLE